MVGSGGGGGRDKIKYSSKSPAAAFCAEIVSIREESLKHRVSVCLAARSSLRTQVCCERCELYVGLGWVTRGETSQIWWPGRCTGGSECLTCLYVCLEQMFTSDSLTPGFPHGKQKAMDTLRDAVWVISGVFFVIK